MPQSTLPPSDRRDTPAKAPHNRRSARRPVSPEQLVDWLDEKSGALAERWLLEIRSRTGDLEEAEAELLREFLELLVSSLPRGMGVYREQVAPIYQQAAELYGHLAAVRGLAAGEAVEEVQLLREVFLRFLYRSPPGEGAGLGLRELLQLSRLIDRTVTHTSVGHTDTLFFNLFHGNGVPEAATREVLEEVRDQLQALEQELVEIQSLEDGIIVPD